MKFAEGEDNDVVVVVVVVEEEEEEDNAVDADKGVGTMIVRPTVVGALFLW